MKLNKQKILLLCAENQLTLTQVAKNAGMAYATLSACMNGRNTTTRTLYKLSKYFNVSIEDLVIFQ